MPPCRCDSLCCNRKDTFRECKECSSHHTSLINRRYVASHVFLENVASNKYCMNLTDFQYSLHNVACTR